MSPVVKHLIHSLHAEVIIHRQYVIAVRLENDARAKRRKVDGFESCRLMREGARRTETTAKAIEDYKHLIEYHQLQGQDIP